MTINIPVNIRLQQIPDRILGLAIAALSQANTHAVYMDPGNEHWPLMSILNAAHAGELFLKAMIAQQHPLLVFKGVNKGAIPNTETEIEALLSSGFTHAFEKLPQILATTTGIFIPDQNLFERLREVRNSIQHFRPPNSNDDLSQLALEFIYSIIDPLIHERFGLCAIQYHEDHNVSYDYVAGCLLRRQIRFSLPDDFEVTEIELEEEIDAASNVYKAWFRGELQRIGKAHLITF